MGAQNMGAEERACTETQSPADRKIAENQKEDKRAFKKFAVVLVFSAVAGAVIGICSIRFARAGGELVERISAAVRLLGPYLNLLHGTALLVVTRRQHRRFRGLYRGWDGDDEAVAGQMEDVLTKGLSAVAVGQILGFFFFSLGFWAMDLKTGEMPWTLIQILAGFAGFGYVAVVNIRGQKRFVNDTKEVNPEKRGSVYDTRFYKQWMESCDEMERMQIYQAGYRAYQVTQLACMVIWCVCFVGMLSWDFGLLPIIVTTALWMTLCVSYISECVRISKRAAAKIYQEG